MNKRQYIISGSLAFLVACFGFFYFISSSAVVVVEPARSGALRSVKVKRVTPSTLVPRIAFDGRLVALRKVALSAEVSGRMLSGDHPFEEGVGFAQGEVLFRIDAREFLANVKAQRSTFENLVVQALPDLQIDYPQEAERWKAFLTSIDVNKNLPVLPEGTPVDARLFLTARGIFQSYYSVRSLEERLEKFVVRAPFDGVITSALADVGNVVNVNANLGSFMQRSLFELRAGIRVEDLNLLSVGDAVELRSKELNQSFSGTIARINQTVDPNTQLVDFYMSLSDPTLKEGLFLSGEIMGKPVEHALLFDRDFLVNSRDVLVVQPDSVLRLQPVLIHKVMEDKVLISGLDGRNPVVIQKLTTAPEGIKIIPIFDGGSDR